MTPPIRSFDFLFMAVAPSRPLSLPDPPHSVINGTRLIHSLRRAARGTCCRPRHTTRHGIASAGEKLPDPHRCGGGARRSSLTSEARSTARASNPCALVSAVGLERDNVGAPVSGGGEPVPPLYP